MLLLHGLLASAINWEHNIPALSAVRTVYALDLANMGESQRVPGRTPGFHLEAERLALFMNAVGIEAADLVAHSYGGAVSLAFASLYPERVRRMVLFAPANPFCKLPQRMIDFYLSPWGIWFARRIPIMPRFAKRIAFAQVYVDRKKVTAQSFRGYLQSLDRAAIEHILVMLDNWWPDMELLRASLPGAVPAPTLLLWGDQDDVVSLDSAQQLAVTLEAELRVLPNAGHLPYAEQPELANEATVGFLTA